MLRRRGLLAAVLAAATLGLAGCKTYPEPTFLPAPPPSPPSALLLYNALSAQPLPVLPGGILRGFTAPATGYIAGEGILVPAWPSAGGPADGLYLVRTRTVGIAPLDRFDPGRSRAVATSSALGQGLVAFQIGPESGPRSAPMMAQLLSGGRPYALPLPAEDRGSILTSPTIRGDHLDFLSTRTEGDEDLTDAVSCLLPEGPCRSLLHLDSVHSQRDIIAMSADARTVYLALKPADPSDPVQGEIVSVPQRGGRIRVLWRTDGILTSIAAMPGQLLFTEDFGIDEGLYLWRRGALVRLTPPSEYPSNPSYGDGYVAWWSNTPELLDILTDRLYRVPGATPEVYGNILTYVTPQGLRWAVLPPP